MAEIIPDHNVTLCREMTKTFESFYRMSASELPAFMEGSPEHCKGEFAVVIGAVAHEDAGVPPELEKALMILLENNSVKTVSQVLSDLTGVRRRDLYDLALAKKA